MNTRTMLGKNPMGLVPPSALGRRTITMEEVKSILEAGTMREVEKEIKNSPAVGTMKEIESLWVEVKNSKEYVSSNFLSAKEQKQIFARSLASAP